jgi:hypothetical protein
MARPKGRPITQSHKENIRQTALMKSEWFRETAHLREAVEAGNVRLALFLVREMIRSREEAA